MRTLRIMEKTILSTQPTFLLTPTHKVTLQLKTDKHYYCCCKKNKTLNVITNCFQDTIPTSWSPMLMSSHLPIRMLPTRTTLQVPWSRRWGSTKTSLAYIGHKGTFKSVNIPNVPIKMQPIRNNIKLFKQDK